MPSLMCMFFYMNPVSITKLFSKMKFKFSITMKEKEVHDVKCYKTMAKYDLLILYRKNIWK